MTNKTDRRDFLITCTRYGRVPGVRGDVSYNEAA
jgi:hypothetical protein